MAGIDDILNMINTQQKQTENGIVKAAWQKADSIIMDGDAKAAKAYDEHLKAAEEKLARDFTNACSSVDSEMKRKLLACRVECIDEIVEKTLARLSTLSAKDYFALLEALAERLLRSGDGIIALGETDLKRIPDDFEKHLAEAAAKKGGTVKLSKQPVDITDGFILTYGLISENCSFRAILEAESEGVRDTAAKALFGAGD